MANTTQALNDYIRRLQREDNAERDEEAGKATMSGPVAAAVNGLTFGFGDEAVAGARSLFGSTSYDEALGQERASRARYSEEHPYIAGGMELAGSLPTALLPMGWAGKAAQGVNRLRQVGRAATTGATSGALTGAAQGFGEGEGGLTERLQGAGVGAGIGGALGGAGGTVVEALAPAGRAIRDFATGIVSPQRGAERVAADLARADLPAPGALPAAVGTATAEETARRAPGVSAPTGQIPGTATPGLPATERTLGEIIGPNSQGAMEAMANMPGQAMSDLTRTMGARGAGRPDRVHAALNATFGDAAEAWTARTALEGQRAASARPLYDRAFSEALPLGESDLALLRRVPAAAINEARQRAQIRGERQLSFQPQFDEDGVLRLTGVSPTAQDMHIIKTGLDRMIEQNTDAVTGRMNGTAFDVRNLRNQVRDSLNDLTLDPQSGQSLYRQASQAWAEPSARIDAQRLGLRFMEENPTRLRAEIARMSQDERDSFAEGGMNALRQRLTRQTDTGAANPVNTIANSPARREALEVLTEALGLPPQEAARRFQTLSSFLAVENAGHQAEGNILRNSATARRQAMTGALASPVLGAGIGAGTGAATGQDPVTMAILGGGLGAAGRGTMGLVAGRRNDALARMLSLTAPQAQTQAAARIAAIQQLQAQQARGLTPNLAGRAGLLGAQAPGTETLREGLLD